MRKIPPPRRRIGAEVSIAAWTLGSLLNVAVSEPMSPSDGVTAQTMNHGNIPRTIKTAKSIPHNKNHFRAFSLMP